MSSSPDELSPSLKISAFANSSSSESKRASMPDVMDNRLVGSVVPVLFPFILLSSLPAVTEAFVVDFGELDANCCCFLEWFELVRGASMA